MAIFAKEEDFEKFEVYKKNVVKGAAKVDAPGKLFVYYKEYTFSDKKNQPMVLIDVHLSVKNELYKGEDKPTASGTVTLTDSNELKFDADKGKVNRAKLRTVLGKFGINNVFVASDEVDDENPQGAQQPSTSSSSSSTPASSVPLNPQMQRRMDFASKAFEQRQPQTPSSSSPPRQMPPLPPTPASTGTQSTTTSSSSPPSRMPPLPPTPASTGPQPTTTSTSSPPPRMPPLPPIPASSGTQSATTRPTPSALKPTPLAPLTPRPQVPVGQSSSSSSTSTSSRQMPPLPSTPSPTSTQTTSTASTAPRSIPLSAYMLATTKLANAKASAGTGMKSLKASIVAACDPELTKAVNDGLKELDTLLDAMTTDDKLLKRIEAASIENDDERLQEKNLEVAKAAETWINNLGSNVKYLRLDNNPFGSFAIVEPLRKTLDEIRTTFA